MPAVVVHRLPCRVVLTATVRTESFCVMATERQDRDERSPVLRGPSTWLKPSGPETRHVLAAATGAVLAAGRAERPCPEEAAGPAGGEALRPRPTDAGKRGAGKVVAVPQGSATGISAAAFHQKLRAANGRP